MTKKFGHESKKNYLKVYCHLIDIKMFAFAQIFKKKYGFSGVLTLPHQPNKHYGAGTAS